MNCIRLRKPARGLAFILLAALSLRAAAQDLQYTLLVIDSLTGPDKLGRGYVHNGHLKAARFIANEMQEAGLEALTPGYFQSFYVRVNTFPGTPALSLDGMPLQPGNDFQPLSSSPAVNRTMKVKALKPRWLLDSARTRRAILRGSRKEPAAWLVPEVPDKWSKEKKKQFHQLASSLPFWWDVPAGAFLYLHDKLTWSLRPYQSPIPAADIHSDALTGKPRKVALRWKPVLLDSVRTQNVIGIIRGSRYPDSFFVFTAHYDHLGAMGPKVYIPGANDNASGVAMLLNLARFFAQEDNRPECSIAFIAFGGEELGLVGSHWFTEHPLFPLENIRFLVNLDMVGTGGEGITVVNGRVLPHAYDKLVQLNEKGHYLPGIKARGKAANSDHYFFSEKGVKAFFIYTRGGPPWYHDVNDRPETLPLTEFNDLFNLLVDFVLAW